MDPETTISPALMTKFRPMVVALCVVMNVLVGFDILVMTFTAPGPAREWSLDSTRVGLLLSAVLIGMALGSAAVAPLARRLGRRPSTLLGLTVASAGMLLSTVATGFGQLGLCRLLTGIGVGAVMASLPVTVSACRNERARGVSVAVFVMGLPLGGVVGGSIAPLVTAEFGWRTTFLLGSALTALAGGTMVALPQRRRVEKLPSACPAQWAKAGTPVHPGHSGTRKILLSLSFLSLVLGLYHARAWTPRLNGGSLLSLGCAAETLLVVLFALWFSRHALAMITFAGSSAAFLAMAVSLGSLPATVTAAGLTGITVNATSTSVYATAPALSRAAVRGTAVGWATAAGRLGSIVAPIVAGVLVDQGWDAPTLFFTFSVPLFGSALALFAMRKQPEPGSVTSTADIPGLD